MGRGGGRSSGKSYKSSSSTYKTTKKPSSSSLSDSSSHSTKRKDDSTTHKQQTIPNGQQTSDNTSSGIVGNAIAFGTGLAAGRLLSQHNKADNEQSAYGYSTAAGSNERFYDASIDNFEESVYHVENLPVKETGCLYEYNTFMGCKDQKDDVNLCETFLNSLLNCISRQHNNNHGTQHPTAAEKLEDAW